MKPLKLYKKKKQTDEVYQVLHTCKIYIKKKMINGILLRTTGLATPHIHFAVPEKEFLEEFEEYKVN